MIQSKKVRSSPFDKNMEAFKAYTIKGKGEEGSRENERNEKAEDKKRVNGRIGGRKVQGATQDEKTSPLSTLPENILSLPSPYISTRSLKLLGRIDFQQKWLRRDREKKMQREKKE